MFLQYSSEWVPDVSHWSWWVPHHYQLIKCWIFIKISTDPFLIWWFKEYDAYLTIIIKSVLSALIYCLRFIKNNTDAIFHLLWLSDAIWPMKLWFMIYLSAITKEMLQISIHHMRCGLVMPYGDIELGQHLLRYMTAPSHYLNQSWSVRSSNNHVRVISQEIWYIIHLVLKLDWKLLI